MNKKFRNIILVLVAITFSFNSFGFIFHFIMQRESIKETAFEEIDRADYRDRIEVLDFSLSDYEAGIIIQRINKKEIRFDGKMFDIVKEEKLADKIVFYCIHDMKEDKIEKEFAGNVKKNTTNKCLTNTQLQFNQQIHFIELIKKLELSSPIKKCIFKSMAQFNNLQNDSKVLTPPPKFILA